MEKVAKWVALGALFVIPFLPLYVESSLYFPYISGKGFAFRILVEIAFAAWCVLFCIDKKYRPHFSWTGALLISLTVWMFVADLFAVNPYKAFWSNFERMDGWITLIHLLLFFVIVGTIFSEKIWQWWWKAFLAGVVVVCAMGTIQLIATFNQLGVRVDSTFGNAIYLANYLLFAIPITVWQLTMSKKWWSTLGLAILLVLELLILFYTETRGALIAIFIAALAASLWWLLLQKKESARMLKNGAIALLVLLVLTGGTFFLARSSSFVVENPTLHRLASIFSPHEFSTRFVIWDTAQQGALERPFLGWGQEGFNYVFNKYFHTYMYGQEVWFDRAHNAYLDWLIAGGVPALILFVLFLCYVLWALYRSQLPHAQKILFSAAIFAYAISALSVFDNLFTYVPLLALAAYIHQKEATSIRTFEKMPILTTAGFQAAVTLLIALVAMTSIWLVNIPAMVAGGNLIQAMSPQPSGVAYNLELFKKALSERTLASQEIREQLVQYTGTILRDATVPNEVKIAFVQFALSEMNKSVIEAPRDARLHSMQASLFAMIGDEKGALTEINTALALSPKKQTLLLQKGVMQWQFKDVEGARDSFHTAYAVDESKKELAAYAAAGDMVSGHIPEGDALLQKVFATTTVNNDVLAQAYYQTGQFEELIAIERLRVSLSGGAINDRLSLALALAQVGKKEEGLKELDTLLHDHSEAATQIAAVRTNITTTPTTLP